MNHTALGFTGRTGGIDHVGQLLSVDGPCRIGFGQMRYKFLMLIHGNDKALGRRNALSQVLLGEYERQAGIFDDVADAFFRIMRIDGYIGCTGLQDSQ